MVLSAHELFVARSRTINSPPAPSPCGLACPFLAGSTAYCCFGIEEFSGVYVVVYIGVRKEKMKGFRQRVVWYPNRHVLSPHDDFRPHTGSHTTCQIRLKKLTIDRTA